MTRARFHEGNAHPKQRSDDMKVQPDEWKSVRRRWWLVGAKVRKRGELLLILTVDCCWPVARRVYTKGTPRYCMDEDVSLLFGAARLGCPHIPLTELNSSMSG